MVRKSKKTFVKGTSKPSKKVRLTETSDTPKPSSKRPVACDCNLCKGRKVDPRTKESHMRERKLPIRRIRNSGIVSEEDASQINVPDDLMMDVDIDVDIGGVGSGNDSSGEREFNFLVTRPEEPRLSSHGGRYKGFPIVVIEKYNSDEDQDDVNDNNEDDINSSDGEEDDSGQHVDFGAPESGYEDKDFDVHNVDINQGFMWIVYWILKFQERHRLSDTATDALVKFVRYVLVLIDKDTFSGFPTSLYMTRKLFGIGNQIIEYATCKKCCKLYTVKGLPTDRPYHCIFQDYPNHPMTNLRSPCNDIVTKQVPTKEGIKYRPSIIFPIADIKRKLQQLYNTKGFEESCRKWADRSNNNQDYLADIYDGRIWKTFKDSDNQTFFRHEVSDSHLGFMLNLDWFQPFENSQYSVGVIYAVICNLPRSERFKPSNIITIAVIPGPNEPKLHQLNHYLAPIIDQFITLWEGVELDKTYESSTGKIIQVAIICCACDIPAARKLCGHISARVACHRCNKVADFTISNQPNFGGFDDMEQWFVTRDVEEIKNNATLWKECATEDARKRHVSETLVRWSEMYRLSYFDPVQFLIVDPMHCLFLGIAKWIVTRLWIEEGRLTPKHLELMQRRANTIKLSSDIGRIPSKIATGEGFSGFTADQWKTFILVYATTITWDLLSDDDRKILSYFVQACNILVCRIISKSGLKEAHQCLLSMVMLVEESYGPGKITPNMHLCLHICECAFDYGPLYAFWCYSFERMNGLLGSLHSSNRNIEPELIKIVQRYSFLDELSEYANDNQHLSKCLSYIAPRETVGSLATHDEDFDLKRYFEFLSMSKNVKENAGTGSEPFPGELLKPTKEANLLVDVLNLLVEYYQNAYDYSFVTLSNIHNSSPESKVVFPKVNYFGRLRIGAEVIGSTFSARHTRSANILSQFVLDDDNTTDTYPGQVQFFFEHTIHLPEGETTHALAFVRWYKAAEDRRTRFHCQVDKDLKICNVELWKNDFYELSRDCIIPVHNILGRFVAGKMKIGKKNPKEYLSVIPINRKIHI